MSVLAEQIRYEISLLRAEEKINVDAIANRLKAVAVEVHRLEAVFAERRNRDPNRLQLSRQETQP